MYTLYQYFLAKTKQEEIEKYNTKHRDYLIRSGKMQQNTTKTEHRNRGAPSKTDENQNNNLNRRNNVNPEIRDNVEIIKDETVKPRRQREFNRPSKAIKEEPYIGTSINESHQKIGHFTKNNEHEEQDRPIKQNKMTLEEIEYLKEMNKEHKDIFQVPKKEKERPIGSSSLNQEFLEEVEQVELVPCRICDRSFRFDRVEKHEKNCEKVFQQKRKVFEKVTTDEEAQLLKKQSNHDQTKNKKPVESKANKWKRESEQFRNAMKNEKGEKVETPVDDGLVPCSKCGRRFNENAAQKHIPICKGNNPLKKNMSR